MTMIWSCAQSGDYRGRVPMKTLQQYRASAEIDTLDQHSDVDRPDIAPDLLLPELCRQKAEECLNLSYQITDPKGQVAVLKLANWWMRLAENWYSRTAKKPRPDGAYPSQSGTLQQPERR
jgi:hypothetical protein